MVVLFLSLISVVVAANAAAQTSAVIRRADGRVERVEFRFARSDIPGKVVFGGGKGARPTEFRQDDLWLIEFGARRVPRGSAEHLRLADGSRLSGQLVQLVPQQQALIWTDLFRTVGISDDAIVGLTRGHPPLARLPGAVAGNDVLYTSDGDRMVGQLLRIEDNQFAFRSQLGNMTLERQKVGAVVLASKSDASNPQSEIPNPKLGRSWVLEFANGDRVWTESWVIEDGRLRCPVGGGSPTAPSSLLRRAMFLGPRIEVFSAIQPQHFTMQPLLAGTRAIVVDRAPENRPLRVGDHEYLFGLFLRPVCEMEYSLPANAETLLADVGLSSELARSVGSARIMFASGDGPWKTFDLTRNDLPVAVAFPLSESRRFRIRVEAADDWASGAHVVLGEPVLVKREK